MRYVVRKEFYGAFIYDREEDFCFAVDEDFYEALSKIRSTGIAESKIDSDTISFLQSEGFINSNNMCDYEMFDNGNKSYTLSSPGRVHFYYTTRCNLNCTHCFSKDITEYGNELTFDEKIKMLNEMRELGITEILIGGGEPFTKSDFPDFVEACLDYNFVTKVFTNGLLLSDELIDRMSSWKIRYLSISVDGYSNEEYALVRGIDNGIDIIKKRIKKLKEKCTYPIAISITVNSHNYQFPCDFLRLADELGVDRIKVRPVKPGGNVNKNKSVFLSAENYVYFIREMQKAWNKHYKGKFLLDFSWGDSRLYYSPETNTVEVVNIAFPYEGYGCYAGKVSIVFDSFGNAIPCGFLPKSMQRCDHDNLREKTIKQIWDDGKKFKALRTLPGNEECEECNYFPACRGGCIARILYEGKNICDTDPWCLKKYFPIKL